MNAGQHHFLKAASSQALYCSDNLLRGDAPVWPTRRRYNAVTAVVFTTVLHLQKCTGMLKVAGES